MRYLEDDAPPTDEVGGARGTRGRVVPKKSVAPKKKRARRRVEPIVLGPPSDHQNTDHQEEPDAESSRRHRGEKERLERVARSAARSNHVRGAATTRSVTVPDEFDMAAIGANVSALCRAFYALGQDDAAMALLSLQAAVEDGDPHLPSRLCAAADPWTARGRPPSDGALAFKTLASIVAAFREAPPLRSEEEIVGYVVGEWVRALGAPPSAETRRPDSFVEAVLANEARVAKMADVLRKGDPAAFVKFVHRELGYSGTNNLGNAEIKRRSRAHRAKKRSTSRR